MGKVCVSCGARSDSEKETRYCIRCGAIDSFVDRVTAPGYAAPHKGPVLLASLLSGLIPVTNLGGCWDKIGPIGHPCQFLIWGPAGAGKTYWTLDLCERLAKLWGSALYCSSDESITGLSFRNKVADLEITRTHGIPGRWMEITEELNDNPGWGRGVVAIDTINRSDITSPQELGAFTNSIGCSFIAVAEAVKDATDFAGSAQFRHWADVVVHVYREETKQILSLDKNRFGGLGFLKTKDLEK